MKRGARWKVIPVELREPLRELNAGAGYDGAHVIFFCNGVPAGHCRFTSGELPAPPSSLASAAARAIAPAVGDCLLQEGFRPALPGLKPPALENPVAALESLTALEQPLANLATHTQRSGNRTTVTVAICTRERPAELSRCLSSVLASSDRPDEVIVIDNAPLSDRTREVVSRFPGVHYFAEPRPGLSVARNSALALATSDVVAFADDDVWVHADWVARVRDCFESPGVMVVTGLVLPAELETPAQTLFEDFQFFHQGYRRRVFDAHFFAARRRKGVPVWSIGAGANMAIRRKAIELGYQFDISLGPGVFGGCGEDSEFWYRILADGWCCVYEPAACVFHYHRRELPELQRQVRQYMQGHVAALLIQFRKSGDWGNLRRLLLELPAEYLMLALRLLATGFALNHRILLRGAWGCLSGLRAAFAPNHD